MPSDSDQKPSYDAGERHDSTPPPEIAIKMSQLHKQASGKPDSHDCEDEELSSDESTTSDGNRDKHNVQSQTTTVANISSLRVARSAKMTTQTPFANYRQIRVISSPTRSYKRHGTSTSLSDLKRRRTGRATSKAYSKDASGMGVSEEPSSSLPTTSAFLLPKSVFEDLNDDQINYDDKPMRVADFTKAHDELINKQLSISKLLCRLVKKLWDNLETSETKINTLTNKEPSLDKPAKCVARLEVALEECQAAVNMQNND
ncbi:hypothetical protein FPOAC2_11815 [Fusarium poae]|uniref:hypothetical protein n=1 Tax=Fusarium poae TaxID=36050 RepID=UPI001CEB3B41|nr:hypothetical protein FPOAC1_011508 [Fusarium poae]KAG8666696.1 hypothetical protein FPOAC1_011508 [Fusarium poae]